MSVAWGRSWQHPRLALPRPAGVYPAGLGRAPQDPTHRSAGPLQLAGPEPPLPAPPGPLGDQRPLVLGDRPADLEEQLVVRVPGHRPVEELNPAAVPLELVEQEDLEDVVAGQPACEIGSTTAVRSPTSRVFEPPVV